MTSIALSVPPDFQYLAHLRSQIRDAVESCSALPEFRLENLITIVSEGTTNAIEAHHRANCSEPVEVALSIGTDNVTVTIRDQGTGFDPSKLKAHPPVTDPKRLEYERGLGVSLMQRLADHINIDSNSSGTLITLVINR